MILRGKFTFIFILLIVGNCIADEKNPANFRLYTVPLDHWSYNALSILVQNLAKTEIAPAEFHLTRYEFASKIARVLAKDSLIPESGKIASGSPEQLFSKSAYSWRERSPAIDQRELRLSAAAYLTHEFGAELLTVGVPWSTLVRYPLTKYLTHSYSLIEVDDVKTNLPLLASLLSKITDKDFEIDLQATTLDLYHKAHTYLIHPSDRTGSISTQPRPEIGPSKYGLVLKTHLSRRLSEQRMYMHDSLEPRLYWYEENGVYWLRLDSEHGPWKDDGRGKRGEFLHWTLAYGSETPKPMIQEVKQILENFAAAERNRLKPKNAIGS